MTEITYPRNRLVRAAMMALGRLAIRLLTKTTIDGIENYPKRGRLIVVANHSGVMETVLITCFAPRQIEYMGSVDIPHEPQMALFMNAYKFIPVYRGNVSVSAMKAGVDVLHQDGVIGIFPEGGIWEPAIRRAQAGVAWMSYHGKASVLPIGFKPTAGTLPQALKLQRPELVMKIGKPIPPVSLKPGIPKKEQFQQAAQRIMDTVWELIPEEGRAPHEQLEYEKFRFEVKAINQDGAPVEIPAELALTNGPALSKILYRTTLINNFRQNLGLYIEPLKTLDQHPEPGEIVKSTSEILDYLQFGNPYYFTYRYGQEEGTRMHQSLQEFRSLARWAQEQGISIHARPIRIYKLAEANDEVVETHPAELAKW